MKQNPIIISLFTLSILFMVSCNDFLEEEPQDRIVAENFFVSEEALGAALTAAYRQLVNDQWNRGLGSARLRANFCGADDWTSQPGGNKGAFRDGDQLNIFPTTVETSNAGWGLGYDVILQANFTIQGGEQMIDNGFDADEVNATLGEAYFLRAWAYFYLVRLYGGLPIVLDPFFTEENRQLGRSPESEVYDRILEDLTFALDHLPPATPAENGRASFWAAKALRAQVYLTMASWPLKEAGRFEDALNDAEDIINEGPFSLVPSFPALFAIENEDTNTEYIWQLNFCSDIQCPGEQLFTPFASQTTKPAELGGFQDLFIEKAFFNRFPEGERKDFTFLTELISANGPNIPWQEFIWKRPFLSKFYSGTVDKNAPFEAQVGVTAQASGIDMPMFRLAEIYLIYAEAHVMGGGGDFARALDYLNQIRRRGKGVPINSADVDDLASFTRQDVIDERGWEFVGEMRRWFDLTRTETLAQALSFRDEDELPLIGDPNNQNLYYHPLPALDVELSDNLIQNPR